MKNDLKRLLTEAELVCAISSLSKIIIALDNELTPKMGEERAFRLIVEIVKSMIAQGDKEE